MLLGSVFLAFICGGFKIPAQAATSLPAELKKAPESLTVDNVDCGYYSRVRIIYLMSDEYKKALAKDDDISYGAQIDWKFSTGDDWKYSAEWDKLEKKTSGSYWEFPDADLSIYFDDGRGGGREERLFDFYNEEDSSWYVDEGWKNVVPSKYLINLKRFEGDDEKITVIDWNKVSVDVRVRFYMRQWDPDLSEDVYVFTPWSETVTYGNFSKDYENIDNLLENPDFENGLKGWKDPDKVWGPEVDETGYLAQHGRFYTWGKLSSNIEEDKNGIARTRIYQDVSLEGYKADETVVFNTLLCNYDQAPHDMGKVTLTFLDKDGKSIESYSQSQRNPNWNSQTIICSIPEGAAKVRVSLWAYRYVGSDIDAYYDYCSLIIKPEKIYPVVITEKKNRETAKKGDTLQLVANNTKTDKASAYTWSSSYNTAATVDKNGLVTFHTDAEDGVAIYAKDNESGVTGVYWINSTEEKNVSAVNDQSKPVDTPETPVPNTAKFSKLSKAKKAFTAKWAKVKGVEGYEIRYSTDKKMTKAVTVDVPGIKTVSKKITGLKGGKKYYVQIRTYVVSDGTKVYSDWSAVKSVKTKK